MEPSGTELRLLEAIEVVIKSLACRLVMNELIEMCRQQRCLELQKATKRKKFQKTNLKFFFNFFFNLFRSSFCRCLSKVKILLQQQTFQVIVQKIYAHFQ